MKERNGRHADGDRRRDRRAARGGGVFSALTHRDYALFWSGALVSNVGNWIQTTALMWYVNEVTGSSSWVAAVNLAAYLPVLLFVFLAGLVADAYDRKRVVIVTMAVQMVCSLALALTKSFDVLGLPLILSCVFVTGIAYTFSAPAGVSFLPELVPEKDMMNALSLGTAQFNIGRVVGPALGAIVISGWSVAGAFYINAISFLAIIITFSLVRPLRPQVRAPLENVWKEMGDGFRYTFAYPWRVAVLLSLGAVTFFGFSCTVLFPALARQVLRGGSGTYGLLLSMVGLGAVAGAPLVTYLGGRVPESSIIRWSCLGVGAFTCAMSLSRATWLSCLIGVGLGCCFLMMGSAVNTVLQARSELEMRGRMVSMYSLMWMGLFSIGGQLAGYVSDAWSPPWTFALGGAICLALAALLFALPRLTEGARSSLGIEHIP